MASDSTQRTDLAGVVLAAGAGRRLRPLTDECPKALCPVGNRPLVDLAVERLSWAVRADAIAVNVHHRRELLQEHLAVRHPAVHVSVERVEALGTAGALGHLRDWLGGRGVLLTNADAWLPLKPGAVTAFVDGWDRQRTRLLCVADPERGDFGPLRYAGLALLPPATIAACPPTPAGLYEVSWRHEGEAGRLDLVSRNGPFIDCGTAGEYLAANLASLASRNGRAIGTDASVVAPDAIVEGEVRHSVVWSGARVHPREVLVDAVRTPRQTVLVR